MPCQAAHQSWPTRPPLAFTRLACSPACTTATTSWPEPQKLEIRFSDGAHFTYPAELLRVESPAADNQRLDVHGRPRVREAP